MRLSVESEVAETSMPGSDSDCMQLGLMDSQDGTGPAQPSGLAAFSASQGGGRDSPAGGATWVLWPVALLEAQI